MSRLNVNSVNPHDGVKVSITGSTNGGVVISGSGDNVTNPLLAVEGTISASGNLTASNAFFSGDIHGVGNIYVQGHATLSAYTPGGIQLGDTNTDNVTFGADVNSSIIPNINNTYDLGSDAQEWRDIYIERIGYIDTITQDDATTTNTFKGDSQFIDDGGAISLMVHSADGNIGVKVADPNQELEVAGRISSSLQLSVGNSGNDVGHITGSGNLVISGTAVFLSGIETTHVTASGQISSSGTSHNYFGGTIFLDTSNALATKGTTNSKVQMNTGQVRLFGNNASHADITIGNGSGNGGVVINEGGQNQDFRIEGNTDVNLLFVDASADKIAIGTATVGNSLLTVDGDLTATHITASGNISASGTIYADNFESTGGDSAGISFTDDMIVTGNITASGNISSSGDGSFTGTLTADGNVDFNGDLDVDGITNLDVVDIDGEVDMNKSLSVRLNITASGTISSSVSVITDKLITPLDSLTLDSGGVSYPTNTHTLQVYGGIRSGINNHTAHSITGNITSSGNISSSGDIIAKELTLSGNLDLEGGLDVNGTTNLDAVDIDGAVQIDNSVTVGVDDTGYDVKFFGAASGHYLQWGQAADELLLANDSKLSFHDAAGGENIVASANGHLEVNAGTTLDMTAPTVDVNASTELNVDAAIIDLNASAAFTMNSADDSVINVAGTTKTLDIDATGAITLDSGTSIAIGTTTDKPVSIDSTTFTLDASAAIAIDGTTLSLDGTGVVNIDSSGGAIGIGITNHDQAINIGTAGTRTISYGILDGTDTTTILSNGNETHKGTFTVGVDDTGHDVKFFGASSAQFLLWDESSDELVLAGDSKLSFHDAAGDENIIASADGHLEINAGTTLDITAPTVDINASTVLNIDGNVSSSATIGALVLHGRNNASAVVNSGGAVNTTITEANFPGGTVFGVNQSTAGNAVAFTLPAATAGLEYTFIASVTSGNTSTTISAPSAILKGMAICKDGNEDISGTNFIFAATKFEIGTRVTCIADGAIWHVTAICPCDASEVSTT